MLACADDTAPPKSKAKWLAAFYLCIPSGYATGYLVGADPPDAAADCCHGCHGCCFRHFLHSNGHVAKPEALLLTVQ